MASPVAGLDTAGAFLGPWRLMSIDGMEWDVPDMAANREAFGLHVAGGGEAAYPRVRMVAVSECASHAPVPAAMGPGPLTDSGLTAALEVPVKGAGVIDMPSRAAPAARPGRLLYFSGLFLDHPP